MLTYRERAVIRPLRPLIRLVRGPDRHEDFPLPGVALGGATWLGYLPPDCTDILLVINPRTGFTLERVGLRAHGNILAECLVKRPLRAVAALYNAARGDERRFRDILRGTCAATPRKRYRAWASSRRRIEVQSGPAAGPPIHLVLPARRGDGAGVTETLRSIAAQIGAEWSVTVAWLHGRDAVSDTDARVTHTDWPGNGTLRDLAPDAAILGVLTPGECLQADALARLAGVLATPDGPEMVYADEEIAGADPVPRLKPDWSPDLALAQGYPGFTLCTGALLARLLEMSLGDPEDCRIDLGLYAVAAKPRRVAHLPRVLLRATDTDHSVRHAERLERYLRAIGSPARTRVESGVADLLWPLPEPAPLVTVVIPSRDRLDLIRPAADGVLNGTAYPAIELVLVDNGSTDPAVHAYYEQLRRDPRVRILDWPAPFDFSAMTNAGVAAARGSVVVLLNNDIAVLREDWLDAMVRQACRPEVGAVGAKLLYADGTLQHAGVVVGLGGRAGHILRRRPADSPGHLGQLRVAHEVSAVTAACLAVEKHKYDAVGGLDAEAFPIDFNDVDLCLRLDAAGYKTVWTPHAVVAHRESTSRGPSIGPARARFEAEADRFVARWRDTIRHDPFYHPALSLTTFGEDLE
ncbi:glycosyltransferase family 2 protein [Methylobacterium sp. J-090]|uniref:glycosyltransferase family 2 protein n=1 Tax=Methylobacterium sp. J-090 TaxID=2836666 RepID=UPI001FBA77CD|nr:glycosyltransferase [Methylobacterium sp. J-090]MCJ2084132.1 glycosyltransferase [Methylobacterium sp. J-090]